MPFLSRTLDIMLLRKLFPGGDLACFEKLLYYNFVFMISSSDSLYSPPSPQTSKFHILCDGGTESSFYPSSSCLCTKWEPTLIL